MTASALRISVIVCTFDPVAEVFKQCLQTIDNAARNFEPFEIIIVDNNSAPAVTSLNFVNDYLQNWPNARIVAETNQGLTHARLRGIRESTGELLIFVDDDNFIDDDYFGKAATICNNFDFIGAFSGRVTLQYNARPEEWTKKYWGMLISRDLTENVWSNVPFNNDTMPNGAGLCVIREVANEYLRLYEDGRRNFVLDRSKNSLMSGGDNDLAMCACDIGKGMGLFKDLHLKHFIPANRFSLEYLSRLAYGIYYSFAVLQFMRTGKVDRNTFKQKIKHLIRTSIMKKKDRIIQRSCRKGLDDAIAFINTGGVASQ